MALYMTILYRRQIEHIVWILKKIPYYFVMLRIFELFSTFLLVRFCKKNKNLDFFFFLCIRNFWRIVTFRKYRFHGNWGTVEKRMHISMSF